MIYVLTSQVAPELEIKFNTDNKNLHIKDSYTIKDKKTKRLILQELNNKLVELNIDFHRTINSQIAEWSAHNVLYNAHLYRQRTQSVDINEDEPLWRKILYNILAIFER